MKTFIFLHSVDLERNRSMPLKIKNWPTQAKDNKFCLWGNYDLYLYFEKFDSYNNG